jgi:cytoskeletal protein CcmA (bactofilin family)
MWKKEEGQAGREPVDTTPRASAPKSTSGSGRATIGPSISIKGDVTGSEDLVIQGKIDGSVTLDQHAVSVGSEGRVNADIVGRVITVEGRVEGDLTAEEQIILRGSAQVHGDIKAPRVVLEDGATFRGLVDMGAAPSKASGAGASSPASPAKSGEAPETSKSTSSSASDASKQAPSKSGQASS